MLTARSGAQKIVRVPLGPRVDLAPRVLAAYARRREAVGDLAAGRVREENVRPSPFGTS